MDEIVIRSMLKWPDVPSVYGWLRLDRRGNWLVKGRAVRDGKPLFERISNAAVIEFIGRNYERDSSGRHFFQNGPQRVFVSLDYTPCVFRLDDRAGGFVGHHGRAPQRIGRGFLDEAGALVLETDLGAGVVTDRDLAGVLEHLAGEDGEAIDAEALHAEVVAGRARRVRLFGRPLDMFPLVAADAPSRFGFVADPRPAPGEPEC